MLTLDSELAKLAASPADYLTLARRIEQNEFAELQPCRIAILSSFTAEPIKPFLTVEISRFGLGGQIWFGPFNQFERQIFEPQSTLYEFHPGVIFLAMRLEEIAPGLFEGIPDEDGVEGIYLEVKNRLQTLIDGIRKHSTARIVIWNFAQPAILPAGLADATLKESLTMLVERMNHMIGELCRRAIDTYVFDAHRMALEIGSRVWFDKKLFYLGRIPFSYEAQRHIGRGMARTLNALAHPVKKCLVLDLDNTLWGGVIGEDGMQGIALGEEYPGNVFKAFQRYLMTLRARGILLAIASKNNPQDAYDVLDQHPDSILKRSDFSSIQIGWHEKPDSLRAIAKELNIGIDTLVFFDDSAKEREFVRLSLPEVTVINVPPRPMEYIESIENSGVFDVLMLSDEDRQRATLYSREQERENFKVAATSLPDFLRALEMQAVCGRIDATTLPRAAQLLAKTNQFNTTTRRYSAAELQQIIKDGGIIIGLRVADRFGDNGFVGVAIAIPGLQNAWSIDSLLLSCRVIGRGVEFVLLRELSRLIRDRGGREIMGLIIPTAKNMPAVSVYQESKFVKLDNDGYEWRWSLAQGLIAAPDYIAVHFEEVANV